MRRDVLGGPAVDFLIDLVYLAAMALVVPRELWRWLTTGLPRAGLGQRLLGRYPRRMGHAPCLWIHAVSLGEVGAVRALVRHLAQLLPGWDLAITSSTRTGHDAARRHFPDRYVAYAPLDLSWVVARAHRAIRPTVIAWIELDLWPNALRIAHRRGVAQILVNGKMSPRSAARFGSARPWARRLLGALELLLVQEERYVDRFARAGVDRARISVMGNLKADLLPTPDPDAARALALLVGWTSAHRVLVGGSTSAGEEAALLDAYTALRSDRPDLRLALCLRHPERSDEVHREVARRGLVAKRRSTGDAADGDAVWLFDTIGELGRLYQCATVCFVGGSLVRRGGQNVLEPAALGKPIAIGPHAWNVQDALDRLLAAHAAVQVAGASALAPALGALLDDAAEAAAMGERARAIAVHDRGASERAARRLAAQLAGRGE